MKKIKQNKNSPVIRVSSATLAVFVLFFSLCIPAFAYSLIDAVDISTLDLQPLPVIISPSANSSTFSQSGYLSHNSDYRLQYGAYTTNSNYDVYVFYHDGAVFCSESNQFSYSVIQNNGNDFYLYDSSYATASSSNKGYDSSSNLYYVRASWYANTVQVPSYSTRADGLLAVRDRIDNPPPPPPSLTGEFTYSLPAGNVIFVDVTNLVVAVDLSQNTPVSYWGLGATQYSGTVSSIPSSFDLPISGTSIISWSGSGKADSFGKYSSWVSHATVSGITSDHNHLYYVVANPLQNNSTAGSGYDVSSVANGDITIHVSNSNSVKVYQLETSFNAGVYDSNSAGDTFTGSNNGSGGLSFTNDTTGNPDSPSFGGMTTPESQASTIHDFLQNIATQISGFFSGAIGAVSTLVSSGRDFMQSVSGLYMWLPGPVYTVLTSAIILVITIGVIKVFI